MKTRIVGSALVRELLTMEDCIAAMRQALCSVSAGNAQMLQRQMLSQPGENKFAVMGGSDQKLGLCGAKVIVFPGPAAAAAGTHQGIIPLFNAVTGALEAIVDAEEITGVRTAATSAVATDLLARKRADSLAILGTGRIGRLHIEAIAQVRALKKVFIWNRTAARAEDCCRWAAETLGLEAVFCADPRTAVEQADIVCTVTQAKEPILCGSWLKPGAHLNAVGACAPFARELDTEAVIRSSVFVDQKEAALNGSGDLVCPVREGVFSPDAVAGEIGDALLGHIPGRQSEEEITLFESVGISVEDIAAAGMIFRKAEEQELGLLTTF